MFGEEREYLTIKILHNDMTVMVPCENAGKAGLRRVIDEDTVKKVLAVLQDEVSEMPKNWNRRFKHNRDKIKTGDIYELAEVVRNLAIREHEKGLSTGEKQMFTRAKKILASELMYALDKDEDAAEAYLDELLSDSAADKAVAASPGVPTAAHQRSGRHAVPVAGGAPGLHGGRAPRGRGRGTRLGSSGPKALVAVAGRPMLDWSLDALRAVEEIEQIVVALPEGVPAPAGTIGVAGGAERSHSVRAALRGLRAATPSSCTTRRGRS